MVETFQNWFKGRHDYAREWKEKTGGKVMGYFCTYVPEELLYAADILPVRILGSHEPQDVTEPHIFGMYCPFCRDCLAQGLQGRYDYLDGVMIAQSCLHIRQAFTSWQLHIPVDYSYYLPMPHAVQSPRSYPYLTEELKTFKASLEDWTGKKITDEDIDRGIKLMNHNRTLMRQLSETRKAEVPPITGEEAMFIGLADQVIHKEEHSAALEKLMAGFNGAGTRETGARLMLVGSENDDTPFVNMVESVGATVVIDDHCTGTRYFWNKVGPGEDRLGAIAKRYIERPACPSKDWPDRTRIPHIVSMAKDFDVAGAIVIQQKFCDPHEVDIPAVKKALEDEGIQTLFLEFDVTVPLGQFKVRVEAFLEMLSDEDLF